MSQQAGGRTMRSRICIATSYGDGYKELGTLCEASLVRYAQTFNYIWELFAEGYEFVFWVDADTLFVRFDRDIGDEIAPDKHLYLTSYSVNLAPMPGVHTVVDVLMAG
jgi:hypothetical protein